MAWYIAKFRKTVKGAWTQSYVVAPDGALLGLVPMDERGKPTDLNDLSRKRQPGIVHSWRGKVGNSGEDHYWVLGPGREYAVVEEDVTGSGESRLTVAQWPTPDLTAAQEEHLEALGVPEPRRERERSHPFVRVEASVANQSPVVILSFRALDDTDWSLDPRRSVTVCMMVETAKSCAKEILRRAEILLDAGEAGDVSWSRARRESREGMG